MAGAGSSYGLQPNALTVYGSKVLFSGFDASNHLGLWSSDGTAAGTFELAVAGAGSYGLQPNILTVIDTNDPTTVTALLATPSATGPLDAGRTISFSLTPSAAVTLGTTLGSPTLSLSNGGTATLDAAATTPASLVFTTTVAAGQDTADLKVTGFSLGGATVTDTAGNPLDTSALTTLTGSDTGLVIDTTAPVVTAALASNPLDTNSNSIAYSQILTGGGDPNALVTISEGSQAIGVANANATGTWTYDPSQLAPGVHTLVASETDAAGNMGSTAAAAPLTVSDTRFGVTDVTSSTSGSLVGSDYTGPVSYLQAQYVYSGSDNVVIGARVADVFLKGGTGDDALAAKAGSNVLDGGAGSSWLVGASGADGGTDTFFVDGRGGQSTWNTLLNFHTGDMVTLWGFDAATGGMSWLDNQGAASYQGTTLHADFGAGSGTSALVTFAGLTTSNAQFATSTGTSGGLSYLAVTRTA